MSIEIKWPWEINDLTNYAVVICDVYAATTNIAYFLTHGVKQLLIVNKENVVRAKKQFPPALVIGDKPKNFSANIFDSGNSSSTLSQLDLTGKTVLYTTNNGSRTIEFAKNRGAKEIFTVSLTTLSSVASHIRTFSYDQLMLIPAGERDNYKITDYKALEDLICIELLRDRLISKNTDISSQIEKAKGFIRTHYGSPHREENFKEVFAVDKYTCVPTFKQLFEELIEITDALISPEKEKNLGKIL